MPIASALFTPAAPVPTGTTAAASGVEANDVGLFSSKVAIALNAGLGEQTEKAAPVARLITARPLGLALTQVVAEDVAIQSPVVEAALPAAPEVVDAKMQPAVGDEPVVVEDVAETDDAASPAAFALVPTFQSASPVAPAASATTPPLTAEDSADQAAIDVTSTLAIAPKVDGSVAQGGVSFIAAQPTPPASKPSGDAASPDISAPNNTSAVPDTKDAAQVALPDGFALAAEAQAAVSKGLDVMAEAKAALPIQNAASAVSSATSSTTQARPVDAEPVQSSSSIAPPKKSVLEAPAPLGQAIAKADTPPIDRTRVAAPELARADVQAAPSDDGKAAAAPIAQVMTAAQIATAQIQVSVVAQMPKPAPLVTADVAAAVVAAELSVDADQAASDQSIDATPADKPAQTQSPTPQAAPPIRAARHELAQQTGNAATAPAQTETTNVPAPPSAKADTTAPQTVAQPAKTAEAIAPASSAPVSVAPEAQAANAAADTQSVQQVAAPSRDLGLSTLSRATVETTAQLAAQIARKLDGRSTRFDMVLTPEDLGRVDVQLEIGKDGQLTARLAFDNPAAAVELKGRADELRRQLQDAGFQVAGDALDFSQRDPSAGGGAFDRQQQRNALFAGGSRLAAQADAPIVPAPGAWINHSQTPDRVDLKV